MRIACRARNAFCDNLLRSFLLSELVLLMLETGALSSSPALSLAIRREGPILSENRVKQLKRNDSDAEAEKMQSVLLT